MPLLSRAQSTTLTKQLAGQQANCWPSRIREAFDVTGSPISWEEIAMKILVIDIGGTNVKMLATGHEAPRKFPSGPELTPEKMVAGVLSATADWDYDAVSIGFPGPVLCGQPMAEPVNLG